MQIRGQGLRQGRRPALWPGLALVLVVAFPAPAAPPLSGSIAAAATAEAEYGTIKGRLVWGGEEVPAPKVLQEVGKAQAPCPAAAETAC